jgi:hypothetical protein
MTMKSTPSISDQNHYRTNLSNGDVRQMRVAYRDGEATSALARRYRTSVGNVLQLCSGRRFKGAGGPITSRKPRILTDWDAMWIRVIAADTNDADLAAEFGIGRDMVKRIRCGISYRWLDEFVPRVRRQRRSPSC